MHLEPMFSGSVVCAGPIKSVSTKGVVHEKSGTQDGISNACG
jgi:hypothetical protein